MRQPTQRELNRLFAEAFFTSKRSPPARRQRALMIVAALFDRYDKDHPEEARRVLQEQIHDLHRRAVAGQPGIAALYEEFAPNYRAMGLDVPALPEENDR